jgi:hypothetical protein
MAKQCLRGPNGKPMATNGAIRQIMGTPLWIHKFNALHAVPTHFLVEVYECTNELADFLSICINAYMGIPPLQT